MGFGTTTKQPHIELRDGVLVIEGEVIGPAVRFQYSSRRQGDEIHRLLEIELEPVIAPAREDFTTPGLLGGETKALYQRLSNARGTIATLQADLAAGYPLTERYGESLEAVIKSIGRELDAALVITHRGAAPLR